MPNSDEPVLLPEILGPRLTVYHLLDSFLDPGMTEHEICRIYNLTAEKVAAARAFVLRNADTVLAQHLKIEEKLAPGNPPQVREAAERARAAFTKFKEKLAPKDAPLETEGNLSGIPTFKEWLADQQPR